MSLSGSSLSPHQPLTRKHYAQIIKVRLGFKVMIRVRKKSESEWELPKRNGLIVKRNDICGNITSWLV